MDGTRRMTAIRQLSASVVNKIAAGEVIERPASVVKELVENSLDARATRIDVAIEQGGVTLARVVDNGGGIPAEELPLAVASHATSKLADADDLFRVRTLGFRGEALASIGEVSRLVLRSRPTDGEAAELDVNGGRLGDVTPCAAPTGTTVEVHDLFYNTPVRRKFLRTAATELGHVSETITRLALAHPHVHFSLRHNGRGVFDLPPADDMRTRVAEFFGQELADDLLWVESQDDAVRLSGWVARPNQSRSNARMQYLFLNGRFIRDRALQHALAEAYRGLLTVGRHPVTMLYLEMPPELVDVNVHPTKLEVRFQDGGRLYSQLLGTLRTRFLTTDLTHRLEPAAVGAEAGEMTDGEGIRRQLNAWADSAWNSGGADASATMAPGFGEPPATWREAIEPSRGLGVHPVPADGMPERERVTYAVAPRQPPGASEPAAPSETHGRSGRALQIHNRYLVAETDEGMMIIDQHALHERILYEQIRGKVLSGALETQHLLVPEPVDLAPAEAALVLEHRELLAQLGVSIEPFGGGTVLVSSYPAMLARMRPVEVLRELVDQLSRGSKLPERRDMVDEILHMMSCKAAIKAGDRLTPDEVTALLEQRHLAQDAHHCPHGRPTALVFTREELDRQFKRT